MIFLHSAQDVTCSWAIKFTEITDDVK